MPGPQSDSGALLPASGTGRCRLGGYRRCFAKSVRGWVAATQVCRGVAGPRPDTISWSAVYGYRPAELSRGYDQWDYRGFAEFTGEHTGNVRERQRACRAAAPQPSGSDRRCWPSIKNIAIEAACRGRYFVSFRALYGREHFALPSTSAISNTPPNQLPLKGHDHEKGFVVCASRALLRSPLTRNTAGQPHGLRDGLRALRPCDSRIDERHQGVNRVDVDLNTGLVSIKLEPGNPPPCTSLTRRSRRTASPTRTPR